MRFDVPAFPSISPRIIIAVLIVMQNGSNPFGTQFSIQQLKNLRINMPYDIFIDVI